MNCSDRPRLHCVIENCCVMCFISQFSMFSKKLTWLSKRLSVVCTFVHHLSDVFDETIEPSRWRLRLRVCNLLDEAIQPSTSHRGASDPQENQHESAINRTLLTSYVFLLIIGRKLALKTATIPDTRKYREIGQSILSHKCAKSSIQKTPHCQ
jgi:hypothetical protein